MKKMYKKYLQKNLKKMDLLDHLKMSILNFNFVMIYILYKMLVVFKNHLYYLKDNVFECFFKKYNRLLFFLTKLIFFSEHIMIKNPRPEEDKIIKDIRNLSKLKKELNYTAIKDTTNLFILEKKLKQLKIGY